jgi:hypothetical protein
LEYAGQSNTQKAVELINAFYKTGDERFYNAFVESIPHTSAMRLGMELKELHDNSENEKSKVKENAKKAESESITNFKNSILSAEDKKDFYTNPVNKEVMEFYLDASKFSPDSLVEFVNKIRSDERQRALVQDQANKAYDAQNANDKARMASNLQLPHVNNQERTFTAKELAKMSDAEFAKHEHEIDKQMAQGLIK